MIANPGCTASAIGRGARHCLAATLLGIFTLAGMVPRSAATDWTFDWTTAGGWTGGSVAPRVYSNVAGSGYDIRVSIGIVNGTWTSYNGGPCGGGTVVPCLNGNPGQGQELFLGVDFSNSNLSNITLLFEFCASGASATSCTAKPAAVKGLAIRDLDRANNANSDYQDVVTVTARDNTGTSGAIIVPDALTQFTTTTPGWAVGGTGTCTGAAVVAGSHGISGGPAGATTTSVCGTTNTFSATGTGGGAGNETNPSTWASVNFATKLVRSVLVQYTRGDCGSTCGNSTVQGIWISDLVFSNAALATHAVIADVRAYADGGQSWVEWETASEIGTTGFNVYRLEAGTGTFVKLNERPLPALGATRQGGVYRLADPSVVPGVVATYGIEEVEASGDRHVYGPFSVVGGSAKPAPRRATATAATLRSSPETRNFERVAHASGLGGADSAPAAVITPKVEATTIPASGSAMRIRVEEAGLYVITADQIGAALGAKAADVGMWIARGQLRLRQGGQPVAWKAGPLNDRLFFYGEAISGNDSVYTRYNVYWLDQGAGLTMSAAGAASSGVAPAGQSFPSSVHVAQYGKPLYFLFTDPDADLWYWDYVWSGGGATDFRVPVPDVAVGGGTATLTVTMLGASSDERSARLRLNPSSQNCDLGASPAWKGIAPQVFTTQPFAASCLNAGDNVVRVTADVPAGADSYFWVKAFDVAYPRAYRAAGDRLSLRGAGNAVVRVDGFSRPDIAVLDISDPRKPRWMSSATLSSRTAFAVSFAPTGPDPTYLAAVAQPPYSVEADTPATLKSAANAASYLVVTPQSLRTGADLLATYRGGKVVDLQDIYDEFNYGIANPHAIRDFLAYAYQNWSTRPRSVALLGKGTIDPKEYWGFAYNLFPVLLAPTPNGLFNSDNRYADFNDDGVPDIAVGRIPARNVDDVINYVAKVRAYETTTAAGGARGSSSPTALVVADNPDPEAGDFTADSLLVAQALQARKVTLTTIDRAASASGNEVRQKVIAALNSSAGVGLFNYFGHAAYFALGHDLGDPLFSNDDVSLLNNATRLPIFAAFTCEVGDGSYPGTTSLVETLLWRRGGGAVAAFAPTGLSIDDQASVLSLGLVDALTGTSARATLGEAALSALADLAKKGGQRYMLDIYQVIGDPALRTPR